MVSLRSTANKRVLCFSFVLAAILGLSFLFIDNSLAACNSAGYCYGTGGNPKGGKCGDPNNNGAWWDTCFGLSWQYYLWPRDDDNNPIDMDITFPGSTNAGVATVSRQCKDYGGFWFLGYEVYRPSTGESLGYQAGAPKVSMLSDYDSVHGYTPLYVGEETQPNPGITIVTPSGTKKLKGDKYGDAYAMSNREGDIYKLFWSHSEDGTLVSGSGKGASTASFADLNWFCAETPPPPPPPGKISGLVEVSYNGRKETAGWNNPAEANINISINEGGAAEITFNDYMKGDGNVVRQRYTINGDFVSGSETNFFVATAGDESTRTVGSHTQTVTTAGKYCEILEFVDKSVVRTMHACATVKVIPTPPAISARVGVEAVIYDEDDNVKATIPLAETDWNGLTPARIQVPLDESDYAEIHFIDSMKGDGANPAEMRYTTSNDALSGVRTDSLFYYAGGDASGVATVVKNTDFLKSEHREVNQAGVICETLSFGEEPNNHTVVACAEVTKTENPPHPTPKNDEDSFNFNVDVDLKLTVSLSNKLVKSSGINEEFLRDYTTLGVSSNNLRGYTATCTTDKKSTNENATNLIHDYKDSVVPTLTEPVTRGEFPTGRWGYSIDDTREGDDNSTYAPLVAMDSASPIEIISTTEPGSTNQDVYFATKMDAIQPTGTYSNSVVFKVVTNVISEPPTSINEIRYMQEINDDVIASMIPDQQYQLEDKRDGKKYWVAKFNNGYVMMTQNLDLELKYGDVLSSDLTDIGYGDARGGYKSGRSYWIVDHTTQTTTFDPTTLRWERKSADGNVPHQIVTYGYYLINVVGGHSYRAASNPAVGTFGEASYDYYLGAEGTPAHYLDDEECAAVSGYSEEECAHGRVGVLYSDVAAYAGPEPRLGNYQNNEYYEGLTDSICPKGWRLPDYDDMNLFSRMIASYQNDEDPEHKNRLAPFYFNKIPYYSDYSGPSTSDYSNYRAQHSYYASLYYYVSDNSFSYSYHNYNGYEDNDGYAVRCLARYGIKE